MKYNVEKKDNSIIFSFSPLISNKEVFFEIQKSIEKAKPIMFYTATTDIRDFIANVIKIENNKCIVKGLYRGEIRQIDGVIIKDDKINKVGQRVMVMEHVSIDGRMELIATTKRIINLENPNLNFINVGYSNKSECEYFRIDIYTGDNKKIKGQAIV